MRKCVNYRFFCLSFLILTYTGSISGIDLNTKIVTTGWLRSNLENEKIRVMDVRPQSEYGKSHICGAVYIDIEQISYTDLCPCEIN